MKNILKVFAAMMIFAMPLSAQAKKTLPQAVKQIQQKIEKYRPAAKHNQVMTRAEVAASLDSVIEYFDDEPIRKVFMTFDGEWNEKAYYNVSLESDSLIKDKCERSRSTDAGIEVINYIGYENEWYPFSRVLSDENNDVYYSYNGEDWICNAKYNTTVETEDDKVTTTETVVYYNEKGEQTETSSTKTIKIDGKVSMVVYDGDYGIDDEVIYPLIVVYEYDDIDRVSKLSYQDEYNQLQMEEVYNYDDEYWDFTKVTMDADSVIYDRYSEKAVGPYTAYTFEERKEDKDGELVMEMKVDVEIDEDGSYVITETDYDEEGNGSDLQKTVNKLDEDDNLISMEIYSSVDGEWVFTNSETREYLFGLLVKVTKINSEEIYPHFTYYYYNDGTHTGIEVIAMPESQQTGQCFDLQGRAVSALASGLVVRNGKVVLIRN